MKTLTRITAVLAVCPAPSAQWEKRTASGLARRVTAAADAGAAAEDDAKAYTKPFTVRINQQIMADTELIGFVCNENQQFRRRVKID